MPVDPLAGKIVIDTNNYYPQRDGHIAELDNESTTTSELLQAHLPTSKVVKAFNHIYAAQLTTDGRPTGTKNRRALVIAGNDAAAKAAVTRPAGRVRVQCGGCRPARGGVAHSARHARLWPATHGGRGWSPWEPPRCFTLVSLIPRFYPPGSGAVTIDGSDIREFTIRSLRRQIGFVLQDTQLFYAPIWQNIASGKPDATRDEIIRAARADLILVLDQGRIVERGTHQELIARNGLYAKLLQLQRRDEGRSETNSSSWSYRT